MTFAVSSRRARSRDKSLPHDCRTRQIDRVKNCDKRKIEIINLRTAALVNARNRHYAWRRLGLHVK